MRLTSPFRGNEKYTVMCEIANSESGKGTLYKGKYHHLDYEPTRNETDFKCTGVKLIIRRNAEALTLNFGIDNMPEYVPFKLNFIESLFINASYKDRLIKKVIKGKREIDDIDKRIDAELTRKLKAIEDAKVWELNDTSDREKAVAEHVKKIKKCQLRIDATMKEITPEAEPKINSQVGIEYELKTNELSSNKEEKPITDYSVI